MLLALAKKRQAGNRLLTQMTGEVADPPLAMSSDDGLVDPETFWLIFREGANWALREHPKIAPVIPTIAEFILLLSQPLDDPLPERSPEFRAGVVWIMKAGAQISPVLQLAAEMIVLMASTRQASPDLLDICQRLLADEILDLPKGWVGVRREHVRGLRVALDAIGKIATT